MNLINDKCTGCTACVAVCPKNALTIGQDNYGFYRPVLDEKLCVKCGLCEKVCPINSEAWKESRQIVGTYACSNRDDNIRLNSSSGGMFYELAQLILEQNGKVYGCAWTSPIKAEHIGIDSMEELLDLTKSKYVQSNIGGTYRSVKADIEKGIKVLFCGTPCQVAGLRSFLGKNPDNLFTIDFICHGVPSPKTLACAVDELETKYRKKVKELNFRCKQNGWNVLSLEITFEDETSIVEKAQNNSYYRAFLLSMGLSECCTQCQYNVLPRIADITLGDFWGIPYETVEKFQDDRGVSCVVVNSEKGMNLFENVKKSIVYRIVAVEDIMRGNPFLNGHCKPHPRTKEYFNWLKDSSDDFTKTIDAFLKPRKQEVFIEIAKYQLDKLVRKSRNVFFLLKDYCHKKSLLRKLKVRDFTIISNNCWGSFTYQKFGLKYLSPTVGLYILGHDFVKLCSDWKNYFSKELTFIPWNESSRYYALKDITPYPVAKLGDIEIYFMHYHSEEEAKSKWERRIKRINTEHMLFKLSQREGCSKADVEQFMSLPLRHKLCFAYDEVAGTIHVPELREVEGDEYPVVSKYVNDISILNEL